MQGRRMSRRSGGGFKSSSTRTLGSGSPDASVRIRMAAGCNENSSVATTAWSNAAMHACILATARRTVPVSGQKATMVTARTTSWRLDLLGPWLPALDFRFALRKDVWKSAAFSAHSLDMDCT